MLRPHLGSRLVSAMLTYGVRCRTLSDRKGIALPGIYEDKRSAFLNKFLFSINTSKHE